MKHFYTAMKIKWIVSQAFFLGNPCGKRFFFYKPQPQLVSDKKTTKYPIQNYRNERSSYKVYYAGMNPGIVVQ